MDQAGCSIKAENSNLQIEENGLVIMKGIRRNGLYVLTGSIAKPAIIASVSSDKTKLWHMRLAHMSEKGLKELSKQGLLGNDQITSLQFCEKCVFDLWGPSQVPSYDGARYFITFIDDYSRRVWVYVLKHKNEAFERFKEWTALMENQTEKRLKRLRTDNGLEYCNKDFENFCKSKGIARHRTVRNTPQQNGLAERINRTLIEKVRCMLLNANLSKHFWAEAVNTAAYMINRSPSSALDFKTPQEVWSGKPPNLSNLRVESKDILKESEKITESHHRVNKALELDNYQLARDRERRVVKMPKRYGIADLISYALMVVDEMTGEELENFKQAMDRRDKWKWLSAMEDEMTSLKKNNTWVLVQRPAEKRLVAKGFTQNEGIDFNEVFSPVVKHSSIRIILAITTFFDLELDQMDVKTAFLHGNLEEEILMAQPEGFVEEGTEDMVCLLKKSLYGLKQSPRQWYLRFDEFMLSHDFNRSEYDNCVYFRKLNSGDQISLLLYVDDMLIACKHKEEIKKLKAELMAVFEMKDLGPAAKILGMQIKRDRHAKTLFLTQTGYLKRVVNIFGMVNSKPVTTPVAVHFKLSKQHAPQEEADIDHMRKIPYSSAVGSIMYAMVCTRPDVAYGIGLVSRFMGNLGKEH
ncbi:hypothetical protein KPL71_012080 [Citrus sinensis]|uniref:Uncharacterized protein n=1 Tax=Citrus sinensis TaxID=2711 RepID=A0ACB8L872_CITSI|nr:hypothetical protein KPL71_012080 [Citrus sinensis]